MSKRGGTKLLNDFVNLTDELGYSYKFNKNKNIFFMDNEEVDVEVGTVFYDDNNEKYEYFEGQLVKAEDEFYEPEKATVDPDDFEDYTDHSKKVEEQIKNMERISKTEGKVSKEKEEKTRIRKSVETISKDEKIRKMIEESDQQKIKNREFENFDEIFNAFFRKGKTESDIYFELRRRLTIKIFKETGVSSTAAISLGHLIMTKLKLDVKYSQEVEKIIKLVLNKI